MLHSCHFILWRNTRSSITRATSGDHRQLNKHLLNTLHIPMVHCPYLSGQILGEIAPSFASVAVGSGGVCRNVKDKRIEEATGLVD